MLWLLGKLSGNPKSASRKKLVLVTCQCARLSLGYVKKGELRPLRAIEVAEAWARGGEGITLEDVRNAAYAGASAAYASDAGSASYAASYAAACAAACAGYAGYASYAAYAGTLAKCADIVREYYPDAPKLERRGERWRKQN